MTLRNEPAEAARERSSGLEELGATAGEERRPTTEDDDRGRRTRSRPGRSIQPPWRSDERNFGSADRREALWRKKKGVQSSAKGVCDVP